MRVIPILQMKIKIKVDFLYDSLLLQLESPLDTTRYISYTPTVRMLGPGSSVGRAAD